MYRLVQTSQLARLFSAHLKEMIRAPGVILWGFIFPILIALGLGIAFTEKSDIVRSIAVIEPGLTPGPSDAPDSKIATFLERHTQELPAQGRHPGRFRLELKHGKLGDTTFYFIPASWEEALTLLKKGHLSIIMEKDIDRIHYHFDPLNTDTQLTYLKLKELFNNSPSDIQDSKHEGVQPLSLKGTRYIDFLIPGLIAMNIMMSCMWGISFNTIEKRSRKLLRRMTATPMRKSYYLASLMAARILRNLIEAIPLVVFAWIVFDVRIQGSIYALLTIFVAGNIAFGGIAIFSSSRTASMEFGNRLINLIVMPMTVLSGIFFSYHNFPGWSIPLIQILPLTLLADSIRSVFIEGAGFLDIALSAFILTTVGGLFFSAALKIFKWY